MDTERDLRDGVDEALRTWAGCTVQSFAALGNGAPDLLVGIDDRNLLGGA
jgi:hypothetical protein